MRRIRITPIRENESENHRERCKRRSQILASVMHWAHDAGAIRVEFNPAQAEPFRYITPDGDDVTTKLGKTPPEHVASLVQIIHETIEGHPLLRPFRRLARSFAAKAAEVQIEIPPTPIYSGSTWHCIMNKDTAVFVKQSDTEPLTNSQ